MLERVKRKGNPSTLFVEMQIGEATMENRLEVPLKNKNRATIWSKTPSLEHLSGEKSEKIHAPQCSRQHYLQQMRHSSSLNVH